MFENKENEVSPTFIEFIYPILAFMTLGVIIIYFFIFVVNL